MSQKMMKFGHVAVFLLTYAAALSAGQDHDERKERSPKFDLWSDAEPLKLQGTDDDDNSTDEETEAERWCEGETACNKTCPLLGYKTGDDGECLMCTCRHSGRFEGDILVKETQYNSLLELYGKTETPSRSKRGAEYRTRTTWPAAANGVVSIAYVIDPSLKSTIRKLLKQAFKRYHDQTCLRFVPRTGQQDYLRFQDANGCGSFVGRMGGEQEIDLGTGCAKVGTIMHELMHAVGFWHEQSRADRDGYVTVVAENIEAGAEHNFAKMQAPWNDFGSAYDYGSLMHYGGYYFSKDDHSPTLRNAKTGMPISRFPQRNGFSVEDLNQINRKYQCTTSMLDSLRTTTPVTTTTAPTTVVIPGVSPYSGACGITSSALQYDLPQNIVGGTTSTYGAVPWQVALFTMCGNRNICGAALISNRYILSSANCLGVFGDNDPDNFYVMLGRNSREFHKHDVGQVIRFLSSIITHEDYDKATKSNDIAIAKLKEPVQFTNYIRPVCLPSPRDGEITRGTKALVSGWGDTQDVSTRNDHLQQVDVAVIGSWICNKWMTAKGRAVNSDTMLCAGYKKGEKDTCSGDIGAPLVIKKGQANVLVGINSWGFGCGNVESPSVYTKVSNYLTWIKRNSV